MTRPEYPGDLPRDTDGELVFEAPWQAQAFAIVLALHEQGIFSWSEWAAALGWQIAEGGHGVGNEGYYRAWLAAVEAIVRDKGISDAVEMHSRHAAWERAARNTPHGRPIELGNQSPREISSSSENSGR